jgi:alpha-glucosidase
MTDWDARSLELNLDFLGGGNYTMKIWKDGINADRIASDFAQEELSITSSSKIKVEMAPGGGWVAIISRK